MPNLHRPAVIIGVGGTGQTVLTYLKKELLELNQGKMPPNVRLLEFDTMPAAQDGGNRAVNQNIFSLQNVKLERQTEFIGLSGNGWELGENVVSGNADHIGRQLHNSENYTWFDAPYYRQTISPALWDLAAGAGRVRQFGRLAYFMKYDTDIRPRIEDAFQSVKNSVTDGQELEVLIISSFAGGTGAGMFIDIGLLCRELGESVNNHLIIRGLFVLPRVWVGMANQNDQAQHMMARSFAAWRELDRFMNVGSTYGTHSIAYKRNNQSVINVSARPFDMCYLVDSRSSRRTMEGTPPEKGVMPTIADFVSLIIDSEAGVPYTNDTRNYLVNLDNNNLKPGYSAFRAYSIKVPIYFDIESNSLNFAKDLLDRWLVPVRDEQSNLVVRLAENQNKENPNQQGRDEVIPFLSQQSQPRYINVDRMNPQAGSGQSQSPLANSPLLPHIAAVYKLRNNPADLQTLQEEEANGGASLQAVDEMISFTTYLGRLVNLPQDVNDTTIFVDGRPTELQVVDVNAEANTHIWDAVHPSKDAFGVNGVGDSPLESLSRFKDQVSGVPAFEREHYGAGAGNDGKFGSILDQCGQWQVARFVDLLRHWTLNTLNGNSSADAYKAVSGKLGYVQDFYKHLNAALDFFLNTHLKAVNRLRNNNGMLASAIQEVEYAWSDMEDWAHKKCMFFFDHPRAHVMQRSYLDAVDFHYGVIKDNMILEILEKTCREMLDVVRKGQDAIDQWAKAFVLGGENISGLYREVSRNAEVVNSLLKDEKALERVNLVTPEKHYVKQVEMIDQELNRIHWNVSTVEDFQVDCIISKPTGEVDQSGRPINIPGKLRPGDSLLDLEHNKGIILGISRRIYSDLRENRLVLDQVMNYHDKQYDFRIPERLADHLDAHSDVLADLNAAAATNRQIKSFYLRLMHPALTTQLDTDEGQRPLQVKYVDSLEERIRAITVGEAATTGFRRLESEDQFKLTMLKTIDQIQDVDFSIWTALRDAYYNQVNASGSEENGQRLHIFPAECNAVRYESRLGELGKRYRAFHPKVVMLLENAERVSLFFRCWALGHLRWNIIKEQGEKYFVLVVPEIVNVDRQQVLLTQTQITYDVDLLILIDKFIHGKDSRDINNSQVNWENLIKAMNLIEGGGFESYQDLGQKYQAQLATDGIVAKLRAIHREKKRAFNNANQGIPNNTEWIWRNDGQEYEDMADVAELMYREAQRFMNSSHEDQDHSASIFG